MNDCSFCAEILNDQKNSLFLSKIDPILNVNTRVLFESENWRVVPTIGPLTPGHLLIMTKNHYSSIGLTPSEFYPELKLLVEIFREALYQIYGLPSVAFEHGSAANYNRGGCCVEHTHLHILPFEHEVINDLPTQEFSIRHIDSLDDLKQQALNGKSYLYYQNQKGTDYLIEGPIIPSQFLRQIISKRLERLDRWDWRQNYGIDYIATTLADFKSIDLKSIHDKFKTKGM